MKRKWIIGIVLLAFAPSLQSQSVGPLHQVISTNSLINRPMVFRDLQRSVQDEFGNVEPGLRLELLYNKMSKVRQGLLDRVRAPEMSYSKDIIHIAYFSDTLNVEFKVGLKGKFFSRTQSWLTKILITEIDRFLKKVENKQKEAFLTSIIRALQSSGFPKPNWPDTSSSTRKLSMYVMSILMNNIKQEIEGQYPGLNLDAITNQQILEAAIKAFNGIANDFVANLRSELAEVFDSAEHEIANVTDEFSNFLLSANAGLAVTEGPEGFSGGLLLSYVWSTRFQTGVYINGQFSEQSKDTTSVMPEQSLIGVQMRFAGDAVQLDLLGSALFGNSGFKFFEVFELGAGVSYRCGTSFIVGLEGFWLHSVKSDAGLNFEDVLTAGVSLKGASANSPSVLVGITAQNGSKKPIFQVSFPILARN